METIVYKVVDTRGVDTLTSFAIYDTALVREYRIGVKTFPNIGKLFAFKTAGDAHLFAEENGGSVFKAMAEGVEDAPEIIPSPYRPDDVSDFWAYGILSPYSLVTPTGTVFCSSIMLIEEVY